MKFYGLKREKINEDLLYAIARVQTLASSLILNKEKRERRKAWYKNLFKDESDFQKDEDLSIPENKYYIPIAIVTTDLVAKENADSLKLGLKKLLLKYKSHKYHGGHHPISELFETIDVMDDTYSVRSDYLDCGRFDFSLHKNLEAHIDCFDITIRNFNASFFAIEAHLFLAEEYKAKIIEVIENDHKHNLGYASYYYTNNEKKSGGRKNVSIVHYNNAHLKSEIINNMMIETKWYFFVCISKYFPLVFHNQGVMPPSVNLYKTNIALNDNSATRFLNSVGVCSFMGQYITKSEIIFFQTYISSKRKCRETDMVFVVNESEHDKKAGYYSFDYQVVVEFVEKYKHFYKLYLAKTINCVFATVCVRYRNKVNKIKLKKRGYKKILKTRYLFEKQLDIFKRFSCDVNWEKEIDNTKKIFNDKLSKDSYDYRILTEGSIIGQTKILDSIQDIESDIEQKRTILEHISDYYNQRKNVRINYFMLGIALTTLLFIIFSDLAVKTASYIYKILTYMSSTFL